MNLFLAPHNDDEALFGAYIIQTYKPLVLVVTDSYIQYERGEKACSAEARIAETKAAMTVLGAEVEFLHLPDKSLNAAELRTALMRFIVSEKRFDFNGDYRAPEMTFAPVVEEGGNWAHNVVGEVAGQMFSRLQSYYTYTNKRDYPQGEVRVPATDEMHRKKLEALRCYKSQWANCCRLYFETPQKDEYLCK